MTADGLRRTNRLGLRTLGQRPQVVGQTQAGEQVFEVRGVRLLLGSSSQFRRLVECSECGRAVGGSPVMSRKDLEVPAPPTICSQCSGRVTAWRARVAPDAHPANAVIERGAPISGLPPPVDLPDPTRTFEVALGAVRAEVHQRSADAEGAFAAFSESTVARLAALEDQIRLGVAGLAAVVDAQADKTTALALSVVESQDKLAGAQREIDNRLVDLAAELTVAGPKAGTVDAIQQPLEEIRVELAEALRVMSSSSEATAARTQYEVDQLRETVTRAIAEIRHEAASREQQMHAAVSDLQAMVAALRSDLETSAHAQVDELAAQAERHAALSAGVETLAAAVRGGERRAQVLEQQVEDAVERLSERLDDHRKELAEAMERAASARAPVVDTGGGPRSGSLLDALDDQLRAVEARLADDASNGPA